MISKNIGLIGSCRVRINEPMIDKNTYYCQDPIHYCVSVNEVLQTFEIIKNPSLLKIEKKYLDDLNFYSYLRKPKFFFGRFDTCYIEICSMKKNIVEGLNITIPYKIRNPEIKYIKKDITDTEFRETFDQIVKYCDRIILLGPLLFDFLPTDTITYRNRIINLLREMSDKYSNVKYLDWNQIIKIYGYQKCMVDQWHFSPFFINKYTEIVKNKRKLYIYLDLNKFKNVSNRHDFDIYIPNEYLNYFFDVINIFQVSEELITKYDTIVLDQLSIFQLTPYLIQIIGTPIIESRLKIIAKHPKIILSSYDLHPWSFYINKFPKDYIKGLYPENKLTPEYTKIINYLKKFNIKSFISHFKCPEYDLIKNHFTSYVLPHHIDTELFKDYKRTKNYDILMYGSFDQHVYPFRFRLSKLLPKTKFKVKILNHNYSKFTTYTGSDLSKLINQSWLCVTTVSNFSYLVKKYFEISASNSVILGNANDQIKEIWDDNIIEIDEKMTDQKIIEIIDQALSNKKRLSKISEQMYQKIHSEYNLFEYCLKLSKIC